jgi:hypothetical protein
LPKESRTLLVTERRLNKTERVRLRFRLFVNKIAIGRAGDESNNIIELCQRISWFRVQGSGFKVQGSRFRVQGLEFRVQGSGSAFSKKIRGREEWLARLSRRADCEED